MTFKDKLTYLTRTNKGVKKQTSTITGENYETTADVDPEVLAYAEKFTGNEPYLWDKINNLVFLGDKNGKLDMRTGQVQSARVLGQEAVDDRELLLIHAIYETIKARKELQENQNGGITKD